MQKTEKIAHHVRKEANLMNLSQYDSMSSDGKVDEITRRLLSKYKEYEAYPGDKFKSYVKDALNETDGNQKERDNSSNKKVLNLNQTLTVAYARMSCGPSKRHRPVDEGDSFQDNDERSDTGNKIDIDSDVTQGIPATMTIKPNISQEVAPSKKKFRKKLENTEKAADTVITPDTMITRRQSFLQSRPMTRLSSLAGIDSIINQIKELVFYPVQYSQLYSHLGVTPPCGILLHGPSGCGKTTLAYAIAGELNLPFFKASGPDLIGGTTGESEEKVREIFQSALDSSPSVLFIDSLDVIAGKKESSSRGMDRRIIAQLFDSIDSILQASKLTEAIESTETTDEASSKSKMERKIVVLIAATNKPDSIDPGVRGRFSREISLPVPDAMARSKILGLVTATMKLSPSVELDALGKLTPGFVGADLHALAREAGMVAVTRIVNATKNNSKDDLLPISTKDDQMISDVGASPYSDVYVEMNDLLIAAKNVQPTAKREGFAVVPNVTWSDVGALAEVRDELLHNVLEPIAHPERFKSLGLEIPAGVLFFGPPGCGKTLLAKAIANQSGANFISVKGPELLNMYVGESESKVRQVFSRARSSTPCVIFFDELDALCPKRGSGEGNNVSERVVNQLLTELDGLEVRKDVYIIAATNRLELIDDAILRPGRLGKLLYVPLPSATDRVSILRAVLSKNIAIDGSVDIDAIASDERAEGFTGADLASLAREAGLAVVREWRENRQKQEQEQDPSLSQSNTENTNGVVDGDLILDAVIKARHFESAFSRVRPSVTLQDRKRYERVHHNIKQGMGAIQALKDAAQYISKTN